MLQRLVPGPTPSLQRELDGDDGARQRKAEASRLAEVASLVPI